MKGQELIPIVRDRAMSRRRAFVGPMVVQDLVVRGRAS